MHKNYLSYINDISRKVSITSDAFTQFKQDKVYCTGKAA